MRYNLSFTYLSILPLVILTVVLAGCSTMTDEQRFEQAETKLADPAQRLTIVVESEPSGAHVFGVADGIALLLQKSKPGNYLGKTPLTLTYTRVGRSTYGSLPDETLEVKEVDASPINSPETLLRFKCMVLQDGFKQHIVSEVIEEERDGDDPLGRARLKSLDGGISKTYKAVLKPAKVKHAVLQKPNTGQATTIAVMTEPTAKTAIVKFSSTPANAEIYVDGAFMGNAPSTLPLEKGDRTVEVKLPGYKVFTRKLKVLPGAEITINAVLKKE